MRDPERERGRDIDRQKEKQAPCREPDVGLEFGSPESHPGWKAALNLSHRLPLIQKKSYMTMQPTNFPFSLSVSGNHQSASCL